MTTVAGVFRSRVVAEQAAKDLREAGVRNVNLIAPGEDESANLVPTNPTEQPGMGRTVGGMVGAGLGIAGGLELGSVLASVLMPGVGPVVASGMVVAAMLGAGGAVGGAAVGQALEEETTSGLPEDELYVYKDALRQGRSVVFVQAVDRGEAATSRRVLDEAGAESVDAAREQWWIGLRAAEQEHYQSLGGNFSKDEKSYRRGFEAGFTGRAAEKATGEAYRRGYERGARLRANT